MDIDGKINHADWDLEWPSGGLNIAVARRLVNPAPRAVTAL
jgi:hypothetical protein